MAASDRARRGLHDPFIVCDLGALVNDQIGEKGLPPAAFAAGRQAAAGGPANRPAHHGNAAVPFDEAPFLAI
jgi:hypothetical protein